MTLVRIATRRSPLALWQAEHVAEALRAQGADTELVPMSTKGDRILDQALSRVGGKDLFVKEIEEALADGRADVAVHSLKDVPTELPEGMSLGAYLFREDPRDALVGCAPGGLDALSEGAVVGTCSLRRAAQLLARRSDLQIVPIRGNVQTRLRRMKEAGMAATLLAYAGLKRLGMAELASHCFDVGEMLPAIGQGIVAVEARSDDAPVQSLLAKIDVAASRAMALAERALLRTLEGGCQVPIAGHATMSGDALCLNGLVASLDGQTVFRARAEGPTATAEAIGIRVAEDLLSQGAGAVLSEILK